MRRDSLSPFLPAALALATDAATAAMVRGNQPDYPTGVVVYQVVMVGAALLAAVPSKWVRFAGFVLLLAGVLISTRIMRSFSVPSAGYARLMPPVVD